MQLLPLVKMGSSLLLLLLLAFPVAGLESGDDAVQNTWTRFHVDESGRVVEVELIGEVHATALQADPGEQVREHLLQVRFEPVRIDGEPLPFTVPAIVRIGAGQDGRLEVLGVTPRLRVVTAATPPKYPVQAARRGRGAHLIVACHVGADGRCDPDRYEWPPENEFEAASRESLNSARFELLEVAGVPQPAMYADQFSFSIGAGRITPANVPLDLHEQGNEASRDRREQTRLEQAHLTGAQRLWAELDAVHESIREAFLPRVVSIPAPVHTGDP